MLDDVLTDDRSKAPDDQLIEADDLDRIFDRLDAARRPRGGRDPDAVRPRAVSGR